jgi:anti-sigma-K factor RskA
MAEPDELEEIEGLAAEYVLGTLTTEERLDVVYRMRTDPAMKRAVEAWGERLHPLIEGLEPIDPPRDVEERVMRQIGVGRQETNVLTLQRAVRRWRTSALALGAAAAVLAAIAISLATGIINAPPTGGHYVATLQGEGAEPAFVASIDIERGIIAIRRLGEEPPSGKSYELWAIGGGRPSPQSLGVVDASLRIPAAKLGELQSSALDDTILAVTVEPEGGSPTGQPSGAPIFTGKLIRTE